MAKTQAESEYSGQHRVDVTAKITQVQSFIKTLNINEPIDTSEDKMTPLKLAATFSLDEMVELLSSGKAEVDNKFIPYVISVKNGLETFMKLLHQVKANDYSHAPDKVPYILRIAQTEYAKIVQSINLLLKDNVAANEQSLDGAIFTLIAAQEGYQDATKPLLKTEAKIDQSTQNEASSLYVAAAKGQIEVVELLLKYKANVDLPARNKTTPLIIAAENGHTKVVELLLKNNAKIDLPMLGGATPLFAAVKCGRTEVVKLLVQKDADINIVVNGYNLLDNIFKNFQSYTFATIEIMIKDLLQSKGHPLKITSTAHKNIVMKMLTQYHLFVPVKSLMYSDSSLDDDIERAIGVNTRNVVSTLNIKEDITAVPQENLAGIVLGHMENIPPTLSSLSHNYASAAYANEADKASLVGADSSAAAGALE